MDAQELILTALRSVAVYVLMLVVIRLLGKRTVGNFSAFDLLVALMLGEVVDEIIFGDVTFAQGAVAVLSIAGLQYLNSWLSFRNPGFARFTEGEPTPIVLNGRIHQPGLNKERVSQAEALGALRLQGIRDPQDVKLAQIETDGMISVIREEWAEPLQKKDLLGALNTHAGAPRTPAPVSAGPGRE